MLKAISTFFILLLLNTSLFASKTVDSKIKDVTVYSQYARITRSVSATIASGSSELILGNLSTNVVASSIQAKIKGSATLLSVSFQHNYLENKKVPKQIKVLQDSILLLSNNITWIKSQKATLQGEEQLINTNNKLGSTEQGMTVEQLQSLTKFYRERMLAIRKSLYNLNIDELELTQKRTRIQSHLNQLNANNRAKQTGEIVLNVVANASAKVNVTITYLVQGAGWTPVYDIRYKGIDKPVNLNYKANVYQSTGYDWSNVNLTISNGNPAQNNNRPILNPIHINFFTGQAVYRNTAPAVNMAYAGAREIKLYDEVLVEEEVSAPIYTVTTNQNQITTEFAIEIPQSVPSDGKYHLVAVDEYDLAANYQYHSVPRLDKGAFLLAKVSDFGQYNLLPGQANIFFEDMYVGQTQINPNVSSDTLLISMGRDNGINISRTQLNDLTSTKLIGSNKKQTYAYEIIVKNNKGREIDIEILDAIPISQNSEIEVELIESDDAEYLSDYGKLSWETKLAPGESKKLRFSYSVKYPKDKTVSEL